MKKESVQKIKQFEEMIKHSRNGWAKSKALEIIEDKEGQWFQLEIIATPIKG